MDKKYRYFTPRVDMNSVRFKLARNGSSENFEFAPIYPPYWLDSYSFYYTTI